jgi:hypothetical protein
MLVLKITTLFPTVFNRVTEQVDGWEIQSPLRYSMARLVPTSKLQPLTCTLCVVAAAEWRVRGPQVSFRSGSNAARPAVRVNLRLFDSRLGVLVEIDPYPTVTLAPG